MKQVPSEMTHTCWGSALKIALWGKKSLVENWTFFQILAHCDVRRRIFNSSCSCQNTISQRGALLIFSIYLHFTFPVKLMGFWKLFLSILYLLLRFYLLTQGKYFSCRFLMLNCFHSSITWDFRKLSLLNKRANPLLRICHLCSQKCPSTSDLKVSLFSNCNQHALKNNKIYLCIWIPLFYITLIE